MELNIKKTAISISSTAFTLIVVAFFTVIMNINLWQTYLNNHTISSLHSVLQMFCFMLFVYFLLLSIFSVVNFKYIQKPIYILMFIVCAPAVYFSWKFNVIFDKTMIRNALETDVAEVSDLITPSFLLIYLLLGIIPSIIIWKVPVSYSSIKKQFGYNLVIVPLTFVLSLLSAYPYYGELSSYVRTNRVHILYSFLPYAPVYSLYRNLESTIAEKDIVKIVLDENASIRSTAEKEDHKPLVLVVILGETARNKSFSPHEKETEYFKSLLDLDNLIYYDNFWSCGTNTMASVPCMFSTFTKEDFERSYNLKYENVAEIISRVGYSVLWRKNNHCKGICNRLHVEQINEENSKKYAHGNEFYDEALTDNLSRKIKQSSSDQVIFLHQAGSHGPAYFKRIPEKFKVHQPACESADFDNCTDLEISNAYNNTIFYTKYVIEKAIDELKKLNDSYNTVLVYSSDHGESTGENGYYLHGLPYFMAPDEQTNIPALLWMSDNFIEQKKIDLNCLKTKASDKYSHDNFSHTLLGILDINTTVYSPELDLLTQCRR